MNQNPAWAFLLESVTYLLGKLICACCFALVIQTTVMAQTAQTAQKLVSFDTADQEALYETLLEDYRCLKCQNQNLAGSSADLADDLRNEIRALVVDGKNRSQIDDYLVARYGDFVLYKPKLKASTFVLWFGPFILLLLAGWYAMKIVSGHRELNESAQKHPSENSESVNQARSLLDD